ncbi:hypothetical protein [Parafrankia sp. FMc2]
MADVFHALTALAAGGGLTFALHLLRDDVRRARQVARRRARR